MNRMVWCVFKAVALSMIFVFVWDMGFYLYRTFSLNQRMEMLMSSMTKVVQENNYLPEKEAKVYEELFKTIARNYNVAYDEKGDAIAKNGDDEKTGANFIFVNGFNWNYSSTSSGTTQVKNKIGDITASVTTVNGTPITRNIVVKSMDKSACYGDIMICYVSVNINTPFWSFKDTKHSKANWKRDLDYSNVNLDYLYYVPCMNYTSVTD